MNFLPPYLIQKKQNTFTFATKILLQLLNLTIRIHPSDENAAHPYLLSKGIDMVVNVSSDHLVGKHFGCHSHAAAANHVSRGSDTNATQQPHLMSPKFLC